MKAVAAFVRLVLAALAISSTVHAFNVDHYGAPQQHTGNTVCRSIQLCHTSKAFAYSSIQIFSALEGLLTQLHLSPSAATEYVEITPFEGCVNEQCCCSKPIWITVRLPLLAGDTADVLEQYLHQQLPQELKGLACSGEVEQCQREDISPQQKRKLLEVTAADVKVVWSEEVDGVQFQAVGPVPDMPTGFSSSVYLHQNAGHEAGGYYGSYGGSGSYDDSGSYGYGGYGSYDGEQTEAGEAVIELGSFSPAGRSLLAQPEKQQQPIKPAAAVVGEKKNSNPGSNKAGGSSKSSSSSNKVGGCPPCPACSKSPSNSSDCDEARQLQDSAAGSCYCRYNAHSASWALEESACRAALQARCRPAGSLLECAHVDAFYRSLAQSTAGLDSPHIDAISAFLYVDCPPAPPCSCKVLALASKDTKPQREQCCADLKAHCQVPFSGLDCADAVRFCSKSSSADDEAVYSFALVKTHSIDCTNPRFAAAYISTTPSTITANQEEVAALFALKEQEVAHDRHVAAGLTIMTTVVASCVAVGVAAFGVLTLARQHAARKCLSPIASYGSSEWCYCK